MIVDQIILLEVFVVEPKKKATISLYKVTYIFIFCKLFLNDEFFNKQDTFLNTCKPNKIEKVFIPVCSDSKNSTKFMVFIGTLSTRCLLTITGSDQKNTLSIHWWQFWRWIFLERYYRGTIRFSNNTKSFLPDGMTSCLRKQNRHLVRSRAPLLLLNMTRNQVFQNHRMFEPSFWSSCTLQSLCKIILLNFLSMRKLLRSSVTIVWNLMKFANIAFKIASQLSNRTVITVKTVISACAETHCSWIVDKV